ncbi:MAG: cyanophycin synthetase, partial [Candidatus Omnitrophica bacterium]|nr:cyanophycin synthetase [Candidatus Omnitrophota bacterium]
FMASDIRMENNKVSFLFNKKHKICLNTLGRFNVYSALAGIACGLIFGIDMKSIKKSLAHFKFPEKRLNMIECAGFHIIDDTYNSNPLSLRNAIESLIECQTRGRRILAMGDMLELGGKAAELHSQIGSLVAEKPIDIFVTFGKLSKSAAETAKSKPNRKRDIFAFDSKKGLTDFLKSTIRAGDVLLIKGSRRLKMEDVVSALRNPK